jgi:pilus assembly protein Flp/PilA
VKSTLVFLKIPPRAFPYPCDLSAINGAVAADIRRYPRECKMSAWKKFARDESGATAIEYGLIAAGISVAIITVVNSLGVQLKNTFNTVSTQLGTAGK